MNLAKSFSIYTIASFFNKGLMALLSLFLSHYILPAQNGVLSLYSIFVALLLPFIILGMPSSIMLEHSKLSEKEFKSYFSSSLALSGIFFLAVLVILLITGNHIASFLSIPVRFLLMGIFYTWFTLFQENITAYMRSSNKAMQFLWLSVVRDIIEIGLVILLVIKMGKSAEGRIQAGVITAAVVFLFSLYYFGRRGLINTNISKHYIKEELKFGFSQIFFQLNIFVLVSADKFFINYYYPQNKTGLGIYFMASLFAFIINVLVNAFFSAYQPQLYKYLGNFTEEAKLKMLKIKYLFAGFLLVSTVALCIIVPFIYSAFINPVYNSGIKYVAWNAFAYFFWGLYALLLGILYYYKKNKVVIALSVFSSVSCVILNAVLVKQYGIIGAAWANCIVYALLFITTFITVNKVCRPQLPWLQFGKIFRKNSEKIIS